MSGERLHYLFEHLLTREAAYHALLDQNKRLLHNAAAELLETGLRPGSPEDWDLLPSIAAHLMSAGEYSRAHAQYCRLLLLMAQTGRYASWDESVANAELCWLRFGPGAGEAAARRRSGRLLHCTATRHYAEGRFAEALPLLDEVLTFAEENDDETLAGMALTTAGTTRLRLGQLPRAQELFLMALPIHERLGNLSQQCQVHRSLAILKRDSGDRKAAELHSLRALELAEACGDPRLEAQVRIALGNEAKMFRSFIEAGVHMTRGYELSCRTGDAESQTGCLAGAAEVSLFLGCIEKAEAESRRALVLARETGNPRSISFALNILGAALSYQGHFAEGEATLRESNSVSDAAGHAWGRTLTAQYVGRLARERGDLEAAYQADLLCSELAGRVGHDLLAAAIRARSAEWLMLTGRLAEAREVIESGRPEWEQLGIAWTSLPRSISVRLWLKEGNLPKAIAELERARDLSAEFLGYEGSFMMRDLQEAEREIEAATRAASGQGSAGDTD